MRRARGEANTQSELSAKVRCCRLMRIDQRSCRVLLGGRLPEKTIAVEM